DEVTITCGASEAIASSILAITNESDEILILEPWYENYVPIVHLTEAKPIFVTLDQETFQLDEESLKKSITSKTKAIIVNTPHNPTGHVFSKSELKLIADLCIDHNILAITDEIYEYIIYDDNIHISLGSLPDMFDKTITISGFSKTYSMTGWRVGYVAAEKHLMDEIRKVHDYLTVCAPSLQQKALLKAFELGSDYYLGLKTRYQHNRDYIVSALQELDFNVNVPQGAYYVFADISNFGIDDYTFANMLVKNRGVAVVPGSSFYFNTQIGRHFVRFSFAQKLETLKDAINRIEIRLKENHLHS
ncbi:MAG: pyridoxal phosphate-dependent aminotransferase, partial [Candidatus Heimdallarchaeaceae archaeon]